MEIDYTNLTASNFFLDFLSEFSYSSLYSFVIQFIVIIYLYFYACKIRTPTWTALLITSASGLLASILSHMCTTLTKFDNINDNVCVIWLIQEFFWIIFEYSIPLINFLKLKELTKSQGNKDLNYVIHFFLLLFIPVRVNIGWLRYRERSLSTNEINLWIGISYCIQLLANIVSIVFIFKEFFILFNKDKKNKKISKNETIFSYINRSNFSFIIIIDLCTVINGALTMIFHNMEYLSLLIILNSLSNNFIMLIAIDNIAFRYINLPKDHEYNNIFKILHSNENNHLNNNLHSPLYTNNLNNPLLDGSGNNSSSNNNNGGGSNGIMKSSHSMYSKRNSITLGTINSTTTTATSNHRIKNPSMASGYSDDEDEGHEREKKSLFGHFGRKKAKSMDLSKTYLNYSNMLLNEKVSKKKSIKVNNDYAKYSKEKNANVLYDDYSTTSVIKSPLLTDLQNLNTSANSPIPTSPISPMTITSMSLMLNNNNNNNNNGNNQDNYYKSHSLPREKSKKDKDKFSIRNALPGLHSKNKNKKKISLENSLIEEMQLTSRDSNLDKLSSITMNHSSRDGSGNGNDNGNDDNGNGNGNDSGSGIRSSMLYSPSMNYLENSTSLPKIVDEYDVKSPYITNMAHDTKPYMTTLKMFDEEEKLYYGMMENEHLHHSHSHNHSHGSDNGSGIIMGTGPNDGHDYRNEAYQKHSRNESGVSNGSGTNYLNVPWSASPSKYSGNTMEPPSYSSYSTTNTNDHTPINIQIINNDGSGLGSASGNGSSSNGSYIGGDNGSGSPNISSVINGTEDSNQDSIELGNLSVNTNITMTNANYSPEYIRNRSPTTFYTSNGLYNTSITSSATSATTTSSTYNGSIRKNPRAPYFSPEFSPHNTPLLPPQRTNSPSMGHNTPLLPPPPPRTPNSNGSHSRSHSFNHNTPLLPSPQQRTTNSNGYSNSINPTSPPILPTPRANGSGIGYKGSLPQRMNSPLNDQSHYQNSIMSPTTTTTTTMAMATTNTTTTTTTTNSTSDFIVHTRKNSNTIIKKSNELMDNDFSHLDNLEDNVEEENTSDNSDISEKNLDLIYQEKSSNSHLNNKKVIKKVLKNNLPRLITKPQKLHIDYKNTGGVTVNHASEA